MAFLTDHVSVFVNKITQKVMDDFNLGFFFIMS